MNRDLHERAGCVFLEALEQPAEQISAFLDQRCGDDVALRREVESLLAGNESNLELENVTALDVRAGVTHLGERVDEQSRRPPEQVPERIGPYECIAELGTGGFGVVYEAHQQEPVRRRVAIKVIKAGMDTREVMARFDVERQSLALMEHPGIARVFDAGTTDQGRPYFVMELVDGVPITKYCDAESLNTSARLELLIDVCRAIQHAHQKGVIHRDIKPNNVLVSTVDGKPLPKVIDFGIAKAMDVGTDDAVTLTHQNQILGTPAYMSPEQAEMRAVDIDTRTDVYSLGVLMYELLTGTTPFTRRELRDAGLSEMFRILRDETPLRPSTRLSRLRAEVRDRSGSARDERERYPEESSSIEDVARQRRTNAESLVRLLRGDLDCIVMKCLDKERARRYESAAALADDIRRFLNTEPILAKPVSAIDRAVKFSRRNKVLVAGATTTFLALVGGIVGVTLFAVSEARQRNETQIARDESEAVTDFLSHALAAVSPFAAGRDVSMREVLDLASKRIKGKFDAQPRVEARLRETIGVTYRALGEFDDARTHLDRALQLRQETLGAGHPDTLHTTVELATANMDSGQYEAAEALATTAYEAARTMKDADESLVLNATLILAQIYDKQGRHAESEPLYRSTIASFAALRGDADESTIDARNNFASWHWDQGRYDEAKRLYVEVVDARRRLFGDEHPKTLQAANNLGSLYHRQGNFDDARRVYETYIDPHKSVFGVDHPQTLTILGNLAALHLQVGNPGDSIPLLEEIVQTRKRVSGATHPDTLATMNNLAMAYQRTDGRAADAKQLHGELLEMRRETLGNSHPDTLLSMTSFAQLLEQFGELAAARAHHEEAADIVRRELAPDHPRRLHVLNNLAVFFSTTTEYEASLAIYVDIVDRHDQKFGPDHPNSIRVRQGFGRCYFHLKRYVDAEPQLAEAVAGARRTMPPGHWLIGECLTSLGECQAAMNKRADAETSLLEAFNLLAETVGRSHSKTRRAASLLVALYDAEDNPEAAAPFRQLLADDAP